MFPTVTPMPTEAALLRMRSLLKSSRAAPMPSSSTSLVNDYVTDIPRLVITRGNGNSSSSSAVPSLTLFSTLEEVKNVYPDPPPEALIAAPPEITAGATTAQERKRRRERADLLDPTLQHMQKKPAADAPSASSDGPTACFEEGFETVDYLGRSFLEPPQLLVQQAPGLAGKACQPPRTLRGTFKGGHTAGVQLVRWAPAEYGHLLFSADLHGGACLWSSQGSRGLIAKYAAHTQPIKSLEVTTDVSIMSTGSVDGTVALWDVETSTCRAIVSNPETLPVVQHLHHPSNERSLLLAAVDKKVVLYDMRVSCTNYQREYTGHMGTIFNLTLLSGGAKMLTTSEDRTLRTWDYRLPVQIKQFADAAMHAITHVAHHPSEDYLAAQSLDNRIIVFADEGAGKLKLLRHKEFVGHTVSGTRCQLAFSRDGQYVSSGDISGQLFIWKWATGELVRSFKAHSQMLVSHMWHPLDASRVVTAAWDGNVKNWV